jgi:hypothetical protein
MKMYVEQLQEAAEGADAGAIIKLLRERIPDFKPTMD